MKKLSPLLILLFLFSCKSKTVVSIPKDTTSEKAKIIKLPVSEVSDTKKTKAYELGKRVLMTCNTSKFKPFNESEATPSLIKNTTLERLTKTCTKFRQFYGTFKDLNLIEVYKDPATATTIFRFKALYTKKIANKELRIFMNEEEKVSAIKSMDWMDSLSKI
jgi:hypothetical protein